MGCFLACFGTSKDAKTRRANHHRHRIPYRDPTSRNFYRPVEVSILAPNQEKTGTYYRPVEVSVVAPNQEKTETLYRPVKSIVAQNEEKTETFFSPVEVSVGAPNEEKTETLLRPIEVLVVDPSQGKTELAIATSVSETRDTPPVGLTSSGKRKKVVTFDSNIKTYAPVVFYEVEDHDEQARPETCEGEKKVLLAKSSKGVGSNSGSTTSSSGSTFPPNHRYQNCIESEDEIEDESDCDVYDLDEEFDYDEDDDNLAEDEADDGYGYTNAYTAHADCRGRRLSDEFSSTESRTRDGNGYVHSVLNPVENLSQWKILKTKGITTPQLKCLQKENSTPEAPKTLNHQEIAVDASLSNWLPTSEPPTKSKSNNIISFTNYTPERGSNSPKCSSEPAIKSKNNITGFTNFTPERGSNSPKCLDDRPILGALTVEEIKKFSTPSSPRKSPRADDMPIIGSVGSYWSHDSDKDSGSVCASYKGIPNATSKYREDKRVNWHSTPFETRLDRVLNKGGASAKAHPEA